MAVLRKIIKKILVPIFVRGDRVLVSLKLVKPRIIIYMDGGLCSQMNMWIQGQYYAEQGYPVYYDLDWFRRDGKAIVFFIYWAIGCARMNDLLKLRMQNAFVVIASYVFYGWWDWRFLLLIAFTSFCSYASGLLIGRSLTQPSLKGRRLISPKFWMIVNIVLNLGVLAIFKYYDFFVTEFGQLFDINTNSLLLNIILPVGILG